jgi:CrcB protein
LKPVLLAGAGGFLGSAARYLVGGWVHRLAPFSGYPLGTLVVNVAGCFAIGVLGGLIDGRQLFGPEARVFLLIGVLGGFTTFSSFAYETLSLARDAQMARALLNVGAQFLLGIGAAWLGHAVVRA